MTDYWSPCTATKRGGIWPPRTHINSIGESSSAMRRQKDRIWVKRVLSGYVQLVPGVLVVWDRQPWRIVEIAERPVDLWGAEYEEAFQAAVEGWERYPRGDRPVKETWESRPIAILIAPDKKPTAKPLHLIGPASKSWTVLTEHYAVCNACGELPPCRHEIAETAADQQMARTDVLMDIPAGHCLGCGEAITSRMKAARFPGPNLWRPDLGDNTAVFHARQECADEANRYRKQWESKHGEDPQTALTFDDSGETP